MGSWPLVIEGEEACIGGFAWIRARIKLTVGLPLSISLPNLMFVEVEVLLWVVRHNFHLAQPASVSQSDKAWGFPPTLVAVCLLVDDIPRYVGDDTL